MNIVEFGYYIKSKRKDKGLTLSKLAELSGVSHPYLSQIENGKLKNVPSVEILTKLAKHLDVSIVEIMVAAGHWDEDDLLESIEYKKIEQSDKVETNKTPGIMDLNSVLIEPNITYKGKKLTDHDKKLLIVYLDTLFTDR